MNDRLVDLDVTRAVALIGVCVLNYHGYLILRGGHAGSGTLAHLIDPWTGPLSTRFAATFVVVAGMGVSLLMRTAMSSGDRAAIAERRWILVRRGVLLFAFGYFLDWIWQGSILPFYGAYFVVAALIATWRTRWLVALGATAALAAAGVQWWVLDRTSHGREPTWYTRATSGQHRSPRDLMLDIALRGTHPLLPWLAFLCAGIALGRALPFVTAIRVRMALVGAALIAAAALARALLPWHRTLRSTNPFDRGVLYTVSALGAALVAVGLVGWLAERTRTSPITRMLAVTGRCTLTLYVLHALVFDLFVDRLRWVHPGGPARSLAFGLLFWVVGIAFANTWALWLPQSAGPLEWVYRRFGGSPAPTRGAQRAG